MAPPNTYPLPDLFEYLNFRKYLEDWFNAKKTANPRYSHRLFAKKAGFSSPSLLLLVMQGKRNLTDKMLPGFCEAMELSEDESRYFRALVRLDQSENLEEQNAAWAQISATRRFQEAHRVKGEGFRYLSTWYLPAIREMATCTHFEADPHWIAAHLRPAITIEQAREALEILRSMKMLVPDEYGQLKPADATIVTPHEVSGLAVHNYHKGMLELAVASMTLTPARARHLGAVTVSVSPELVSQLKQKIAEFQESILDLCDGSKLERSLVYQINLQLFPLSEALDPQAK